MVAQKKILFALGLLLLLVLPFSFAQLVSVGPGSSGSVSVEGSNTGVTIGEPEYVESCGNGVIDFNLGEQCDGSNLGGFNCSSVGFNSGSLSCRDVSAGTNKCTFDTTQCANVITETPAPNTVSSGSRGGGGGGGGSSRSPSSSCLENWVCSEWSVCSDGTQVRSCTDSAKCSSPTLKPSESRVCTVEGESGDQGIGAPEEESKGFFSWFTGNVIGGGVGSWLPALILLALLIGLWWIILAKKKKAAPVAPVKTKKLSEVRAAAKAKKK